MEAEDEGMQLNISPYTTVRLPFSTNYHQIQRGRKSNMRDHNEGSNEKKKHDQVNVGILEPPGRLGEEEQIRRRKKVTKKRCTIFLIFFFLRCWQD